MISVQELFFLRGTWTCQSCSSSGNLAAVTGFGVSEERPNYPIADEEKKDEKKKRLEKKSIEQLTM